jgi:hypothetical protein
MQELKTMQRAWSTLDVSSRFTCRRFGMRLFFSIIFAAVQSAGPAGFAGSLQILLFLCGVLCFLLAPFLGDQPFSRKLGYYDEGSIFILLSILMRWAF